MSREEVMKLRYTGTYLDPPRKPNEKEFKEFLIRKLKYYHFSIDPVMVDTITYRSLKGMVRHGNIEPVLIFIRKYVDSTIDEAIELYMNTESIVTAHIRKQLPVTINKCFVSLRMEE